MLGTIGFKRYRVRCIIGTLAHERELEQDLVIDLKVETDFSRVSASGSLEDTVNYVSLSRVCKELAQKGKYLVLEKYASDVIEKLFELFPLTSAWISIQKPMAIPDADCALVELKSEYKK